MANGIPTILFILNLNKLNLLVIFFLYNKTSTFHSPSIISLQLLTIFEQLKHLPTLKKHMTLQVSSLGILYCLQPSNSLTIYSQYVISLPYLDIFLIFIKRITNTIMSPLDESLTINNWPVQSSNNLYLDGIKSSHIINQLAAYDIKNNLIHPSQYEEKLAGTITRVCFSMVHYFMKERHIYKAIIQDITVLCPPTTISPSSLTHLLHPK